FYEMSGGGVTLSGGEALMQPEAAVSLLAACRGLGINTAVETSGYVKPETLLEAAAHTDLFLFDLKHMDPERHRELTGVHNALIHDNLRLLLDRRHNVKIRLPLLKGVNDGAAELRAVADFLSPYRGYGNFRGIDVLPYHKLGVGKYAQIGRRYDVAGDPSLNEEDIARVSASFTDGGFHVSVLRH
ncbi:glycyl-radical enzyme activating protein, partial [uncultured Bilophila sp.]